MFLPLHPPLLLLLLICMASHFNQCEKFFGKFHQLMIEKAGEKKSYAKLNSVQKFFTVFLPFVARNFCITRKAAALKNIL